MARYKAKTYEPAELSIEQLNAIELLIQGKTDAEVGEAVGVSRQTVNGWRNKLPEFVAELNTRRRDLWQSAEDDLRGLVAAAVNVLKDDIKSDDLALRQKAAVHILRAVGIYGQSLEPVGKTDARDVQKSIELEEMISLW